MVFSFSLKGRKRIRDKKIYSSSLGTNRSCVKVKAIPPSLGLLSHQLYTVAGHHINFANGDQIEIM